MQCSTCGMENQSATRFCIHCGAAQTPPAEAGGASTVIAAMAQAGGTSKPGPATGASPGAAASAAPAWATGVGSPAPRDTSATAVRTAPARDMTGAVPAAPAVGADASAMAALRGGPHIGQPSRPAGVMIEPREGPTAFLAPPAPRPTPERLPSISDGTAFTMPATGAAPSRPGAAPAAEPKFDAYAEPPTAAPEPAAWESGRSTADMPPGVAAEPPAGISEGYDSGGPPLAAESRDTSPHGSLAPPAFEPGPSGDDAGAPGGLPPAYDAAPRHKSGVLIVVGLAVVAVLGIGSFFIYQVSQDRARAGEPATTTADATSSAPTTAATTTADAARATPGSTPPGATAPPAAEGAPSVPLAPSATPPASGADNAKAVSPAPAGTPAIEPPEKRPTPRPPVARTPVRPPPVAVAPTPSPPADEAVAAPAPPPVRAAPAPPAPRATDHWAQMSDDLTRCKREDFIKRVVCDQRVRLRYCDGYWGKVQQCPAAPQADHGQ